MFPVWLMGTGSILGAVCLWHWIESHPFKRVFPQSIVSHRHMINSAQLNSPRVPLQVSRGLPVLSPLCTQCWEAFRPLPTWTCSSSQPVCWAPTETPSLCLKALKAASWAIVGFTSFLSHLSGITMVYFLMLSVLRIIVSYILSCFFGWFEYIDACCSQK